MSRSAALREVIIVDRNPGDYLDLLIASANSPYRFRLAVSGEQALRLSRNSPDVLWFINSQLPDMSGLALQSHLRRGPSADRVCLIDDEYDPQQEVQCRLEGIVYLCKPLERTWLDACSPSQAPSQQCHQFAAPSGYR